jgi:transaldolase
VVESVASVFVSRWDVAVHDQVPPELRGRLGIAVSQQCYRAYRELLASGRWRTLAAAGAHPQRLLWGSTGTKDPSAPDTMYIEALAAPDTIDTMPAKTLRAYADHGRPPVPMQENGGDSEATLARFREQGIDLDALARRLLEEGGDAFVKSWEQLLSGLSGKVAKTSQA